MALFNSCVRLPEGTNQNGFVVGMSIACGLYESTVSKREMLWG